MSTAPLPPLSQRAEGRVLADNNPYQHNPACACEVCANGGQVPANHPERGHSLCYGKPHVPPVSLPPWRR